MISMSLLQRGGPLPRPESGAFLTLGNELSEVTQADKARDFIRKAHAGGKQKSQGSQENCSAMWLKISGLMVTGLVSWLSLASHSDSGSFLVACASFSQDGCQ